MMYLLKRCWVAVFLVAAQIAAAGTVVQFRTVYGDIEIELYDQDKPITVQNFLRYLNSGRYQNEISHRLVPGFVIQGGGFAITNRAMTNATVFAIPTYPPITNEFGVGHRFSNVYGTIAMAKFAGDTNSATSQWYINLANNTGLDSADTNNLFVVFGHVISGTNVLNVFNTFQNYTGTQQSNVVANLDPSLGYVFYPNFASCPMRFPVVVDTNLVYVDLSLLQVAVQPSGSGGAQISWNSVTGLTNIVEFTTNFPPTWNTLLVTNGSGVRMSITDNSGSPRRFYRVRVVY